MIEMNRQDMRLDQESLLLDETLLSVANGYIGVRGNFEEGYKESMDTIRGSYINGFYDDIEIQYGESAFGFPTKAQKIVNIPDAQTINIWIDGERFNLFHGKLHHVKRWLDLEQGYTKREIEWTSPKGHHLSIIIKRMASFEKLELLTLDYEVISHNYSGDILIESFLEGEVYNYTNPNDPRVANAHKKLLEVYKIYANKEKALVSVKTKSSGLTLSVTIAHSQAMTYEQVSNTSVKATCSMPLKPNTSLRFTKYVIYTDSRRHGHTEAIGDAYMNEVVSQGIDSWYKAQKDYLRAFWKYAKVTIEGDDSAQEALDYSIYQLLASAGKDGYSNISAKGLSGEGYEGHYFWDTEIYMLPFFTLTNPELAKDLMMYRYNTLEFAKSRAIELGHKKGAKIPWRTISGSECSAFFPAGTAQYHINADVAYSYIQYYLFSKDKEFMLDVGIEVLVETARLWLETGHYTRSGEFAIHDVTGPDEYTAIVNNNFYTNAMAKYHLYWTAKLCREIVDQDQTNIYRRLSLDEVEISKMENASKHMLLLHDEELGIDLQDDSFLHKKPWDFEGTSKEDYPLLLHYHPLTIYRHKVLKQADTVLAHFLLDDRSEETTRNSYLYYEAYTTHDSSLSPCVYGIMASKIGDVEKAYDYFDQTLRLDLDNLHHNTKDGLHIANAGGAYMSVVFGFSGLRIKEDGLHLKPQIPQKWKSYAYNLNYQGSHVEIKITNQKLSVSTTGPMTLWINQEKHFISDCLELSL